MLGVAMQRLWTRTAASAHGRSIGSARARAVARQSPEQQAETRAERSKRARESELWQQTLEAIGDAPPCTRWVSVGDRGSDVFSYIETATALGWEFLLRVSQNRCIETATGSEEHLIDYARCLPTQTQMTHTLRGRDGQPGESIVLQLSSAAIWVQPPWIGAKATSTAIHCWVIRCWGQRRDGTQIEWILLTSIPVEDRQTLLEVVRWYTHRWLIEEYHKCLKSGCQVEQRQLQQSPALEAFIGFAAIVSVRLLQLRTLSRQQPEEPAHLHVDGTMIELLRRRLRLAMRAEEMTMRQFWHATARLGGFIGRKSDGDPGWQTLWNGWQQLLQMTWAAQQMLHPP